MSTLTKCCGPDKNARFQSYEEVQAYLDELGLFHMDMGLERIIDVLEQLGVRQLPCPVIQVVGTNGKGSTAAFIHGLAVAHGFRAGLYTSPHFLSPTERIRLNDRLLPPSAWAGLASQVYAVRSDLTYFELVTAIAALAFRDTEPDVLIFEAGLGGLHDATTAFHADMVCFTPMSLDHIALLGPQLTNIAADKSGSLRKGVWAAVTSPQQPEALAVLEEKARELHIPLIASATATELAGQDFNGSIPEAHTLDALLDQAVLGLNGVHQQINARCALMAWLLLCDHQGWNYHAQAVRLGLSRAFIPGRMQRVAAHNGLPAVILDGAHNLHGLEALSQALENEPFCAVIFSCLVDKEPALMAEKVRNLADGKPIYVPAMSHSTRGMEAQTMACLIGELAQGVDTMQEALDLARAAGEGPILICGSLYLLAEYFALAPQALESVLDR